MRTLDVYSLPSMLLLSDGAPHSRALRSSRGSAELLLASAFLSTTTDLLCCPRPLLDGLVEAQHSRATDCVQYILVSIYCVWWYYVVGSRYYQDSFVFLHSMNYDGPRAFEAASTVVLLAGWYATVQCYTTTTSSWLFLYI